MCLLLFAGAFASAMMLTYCQYLRNLGQTLNHFQPNPRILSSITRRVIRNTVLQIPLWVLSLQKFLYFWGEKKIIRRSRVRTVRWSNFDRRDPKIRVFLQSTEATPCGHLLKRKLTPDKPPADTMFMAAMAMVLPWKIVEDFQSFVTNTKLWPWL